MSFFGIGSMEMLLILAVGLFVVGPKRLIRFVREFKDAYAELRRKRDELASMVEEELELEELKSEAGFEEISESLKEIKSVLQLKDDQGKPVRAVRYAKNRR